MRPKRLYQDSDANMLSKVTSCYWFFDKHIADFTAFDSTLNTTFLAEWKAVLDSLILSQKDKDELFESELLNKEAATALEKCQIKYADVKYYAGKAFPNNKAILKEFGEGQYSKLRKSPLRMVQFMETLFGVASKYKTELIAQNYSQAAIDEIETLTVALRQDNKNQQLKKQERPSLTRSRIELLNTFYGFGQRVAAAAQLVYRTNQVYRNQFLLAQRHHPKVVKTWVVISPKTMRKIAINKLLKKHTLTLTNQSKDTLVYWQANNINETPAQKLNITAGEVVEIVAQEPALRFLIVQNSSAKAGRILLAKEKVVE